MKIRKIKKAIKKSNGFLSVKVEGMIFPINEWDVVVFHNKGISMNDSVYIPYRKMDRVIIENHK